MAINTNDGSGLRVFPAIPQIPDNLGKLDVGAIYDGVVKGLNASTAMGNNLAGQQTTQAVLANQAAQAGSQQALIPSNQSAVLAQNSGTVAQTPLRTASLATTVGAQEATTPSQVQSTVAKNNLDTLNSDVSKIYAEAGLKYAPEIADDTGQLQTGLLTRLKASNGGMVTSPLTGPNGQALGSLIAYVGPDGQPRTQVVPVPFGQLARINTGVKYQPIGTVTNPDTGQPIAMQYQAIYQNAAGGITKGEVVKTAIGEPAPGELYQAPQPGGAGQGGAAGAASPQAAGAPPAVAPGSAQPTMPPAPGAALTAATPGTVPATGTAPAAGGTGGIAQPSPTGAPAAPVGRIEAQVQAEQEKTVQKQRNDRLAELTAVKSANDQLSNAINQTAGDVSKEQDSALGSGPLVGHITVGRPEVQQVQQDIGRFATQIMSTVKNIRNVNEFNAVTANVPRATDYPAVQNEKIAYLRHLTGIIGQRADLEAQLLHDNPKMDVNTADRLVTEKIPLTAEPPSSGGGPTPGAPLATPAPQAPAQPAASGPPPQAVAFLKANPSTQAAFDAKFGQGSAAAALGGSPAQ